ncbi:hypothetical protein CQW23_25551 [Capsicum baccatum]|uniref:Zinc finger PMZ-type domain-containing protein n=1 Tax=Capsicum baccatum TaxID=33114 RepID=A0A2G2VL79_CAPBA|nr:hypothetical protein CQW23_25551 [Capsicum baccatum]
MYWTTEPLLDIRHSSWHASHASLSLGVESRNGSTWHIPDCPVRVTLAVRFPHDFTIFGIHRTIITKTNFGDRSHPHTGNPALTIKEKVNLLSVLKNAGSEPGGFYSLEAVKEAIKNGIGYEAAIECNKDLFGNSQLYQISFGQSFVKLTTLAMKTREKVNFRKNLEELHKKIFAMAKAYTLQQFEELMGRVDQIDKRVKAYLFQIGYHKWEKVHSTVKRTWTMTSNIAEFINNTNRIAIRLPVVSTMDFMRLMIESWNAKQHEEATNTLNELTVKYNDVLTNNRLLSQRMIVKTSNEFLHTVTSGAKKFIVCLRSRKYICGEFQLDEIPCSHAMTAITYRNQHGENYCSPYYNNKNFSDAYAIPFEPLPCEST